MLANFFPELNSKGLYLSSEQEKLIRCLVFTSFIKRDKKEFSRRSRAVTANKCTKKRDARTKLLFCFINLLLFCRSLCRRRRLC